MCNVCMGWLDPMYTCFWNQQWIRKCFKKTAFQKICFHPMQDRFLPLEGPKFEGKSGVKIKNKVFVDHQLMKFS